jgi:GTP cyclohydrolase I
MSVDLNSQLGLTPGRVDVARVEVLYRELLQALGEDPDRDGLKDTPRRVAAWWSEFLNYDPGRTTTCFEHQQVDAGGEELVVVSGIGLWSLCEHHLLPMRLTAAVGYRPAGQVLGLSKFARIASAHAHRLQLQERIVDGIAAAVIEAAGTKDVGVFATGEHLCMSMRGVKDDGARTTTLRLHGRLAEDAALAQWLRGHGREDLPR